MKRCWWCCITFWTCLSCSVFEISCFCFILLLELGAPRMFFSAFLRLLLKNQGGLKGKVWKPCVFYTTICSGSQDLSWSLRSCPSPLVSLNFWTENLLFSCWFLTAFTTSLLGIVEFVKFYKWVFFGSRCLSRSWRNKGNTPSFCFVFTITK